MCGAGPAGVNQRKWDKALAPVVVVHPAYVSLRDEAMLRDIAGSPPHDHARETILLCILILWRRRRRLLLLR